MVLDVNVQRNLRNDGEEVSLQANWGQLVALIVAGSSEKRGVQWRRDLPRPESKEMGDDFGCQVMTLRNVRCEDAVSAKG